MHQKAVYPLDAGLCCSAICIAGSHIETNLGVSLPTETAIIEKCLIGSSVLLRSYRLSM